MKLLENQFFVKVGFKSLCEIPDLSFFLEMLQDLTFPHLQKTCNKKIK